jgi:hypothetical protein
MCGDEHTLLLEQVEEFLPVLLMCDDCGKQLHHDLHARHDILVLLELHDFKQTDDTMLDAMGEKLASACVRLDLLTNSTRSRKLRACATSLESSFQLNSCHCFGFN